MGCGGSRDALTAVDDSVHVMLKHDKKQQIQKGEPPRTGYVPRAEHPLIQKKAMQGPVAEETDDVVIPNNGQ